MNPAILPDLLCPTCHEGDLDIEDPEYVEERVFSIRDFVPRFVDDPAYDGTVQERIADNFGDAWNLYAQKRGVNPYTEEQFLDWVQPLTRQSFVGRTVVELGSGLGGFTAYAAGFGAKQVIGLEISHALDAAVILLKEHPNLSFVQADLLNPPLKKKAFDLVYSIGVLHHLEVPYQGFQQAAVLPKADTGSLFIWVYGQENNTFVHWVVEPLRKLCSNLPVALVRGLASILGSILFVLLNTVYHTGLPGFITAVTKHLPYYSYFGWLRKAGYSYVIGMVTDQLIPPRTHYLAQAELVSWFEREGLEIDAMSQRYGMSWRVLGSPREAEAPVKTESR